MEIEERGMICDAARRPEAERVASFVGLCTTSSGSIFSLCQAASSKNAADSVLLLFRSRDRGRSWQDLRAGFATDFGGVTGSLGCGEMVEASVGRLLLIATWYDRTAAGRGLFDPETEGVLHSKQLMSVSSDDGESWSPWIEIDVHGLRGCSTTGPMLKWPNGLITYSFESYKEFDDPNPGHHGAWLIASRNAGRTFDRPLAVAQDPEHKIYYWDQRQCAGEKSGEFVALFWTHDLEKKMDLNVHLRRGVVSAESLRLGPIVATSISGQIAAPLLLEDGRLLAFVVDRNRSGTLALWQSRDGGSNWSDPLVIYTHRERNAGSQGSENVDFAQYWDDMHKWTFGHPAIRPLGGGQVLLTYYAGGSDRISTHWARVRIDG